eukprot:1978532-Rhodomonas_salina.2
MLLPASSYGSACRYYFPLSSYALDMRCPVLMSRMVLPGAQRTRFRGRSGYGHRYAPTPSCIALRGTAGKQFDHLAYIPLITGFGLAAALLATAATVLGEVRYPPTPSRGNVRYSHLSFSSTDVVAGPRCLAPGTDLAYGGARRGERKART